MEPGACAAPPLPLQEARGLPWSLWRALEKGRRNVFTSLGLCFKAPLQHHSGAQHPLTHFSKHLLPAPHVTVCCSPSAGGVATWSGSLRVSALGKNRPFPRPVANSTDGVVNWSVGGEWNPGQGRSEWFDWVCCQGKWSWKGTLTLISDQLTSSNWS